MSGLGGGGEYTVSDTEVTLVTDNIVFVLNEKSELVVKSSTDMEMFSVGKVFSPIS